MACVSPWPRNFCRMGYGQKKKKKKKKKKGEKKNKTKKKKIKNNFKKKERIKMNPHFKKLKIIVKRRFFSISVGEIRLLLSWARGFI